MDPGKVGGVTMLVYDNLFLFDLFLTRYFQQAMSKENSVSVQAEGKKAEIMAWMKQY